MPVAARGPSTSPISQLPRRPKIEARSTSPNSERGCVPATASPRTPPEAVPCAQDRALHLGYRRRRRELWNECSSPAPMCAIVSVPGPAGTVRCREQPDREPRRQTARRSPQVARTYDVAGFCNWSPVEVGYMRLPWPVLLGEVVARRTSGSELSLRLGTRSVRRGAATFGLLVRDLVLVWRLRRRAGWIRRVRSVRSAPVYPNSSPTRTCVLRGGRRERIRQGLRAITALLDRPTRAQQTSYRERQVRRSVQSPK